MTVLNVTSFQSFNAADWAGGDVAPNFTIKLIRVISAAAGNLDFEAEGGGDGQMQDFEGVTQIACSIKTIRSTSTVDRVECWG